MPREEHRPRRFRLILDDAEIAIVTVAERWPPRQFTVDDRTIYQAITYSELADVDDADFDVHVKRPT